MLQKLATIVPHKAPHKTDFLNAILTSPYMRRVGHEKRSFHHMC